jgi:hypothetical protein
MVKNFRYVDENAIALSGVPDSAAAVDWLFEQGIQAIVSLHPVSEEVEARLRERRIAWMPYLISDFGQGVPPGFGEVMEFIRYAAQEDPAVLIH